MPHFNCSFARSQKISFCERAFYFHYKLNEDEFAEDLFRCIEEANDKPDYYLEKYQLLRSALRLYFYRRDLGPHEITQKLAQKGLLRNLNEEAIHQTLNHVKTLRESSFYSKTDECFVKKLELPEITSFEIEDHTVFGNIDFAWYDRAGLNLVTVTSKSDSQPKLNFMLSYACRELKVKTDKINLGVLLENDHNWYCDWQQIDWHSYQSYIDSILEFSPPESFATIKATNEVHKCNLCEYQQICEDFSDRLDR